MDDWWARNLWWVVFCSCWFLVVTTVVLIIWKIRYKYPDKKICCIPPRNVEKERWSVTKA